MIHRNLRTIGVVLCALLIVVGCTSVPQVRMVRAEKPASAIYTPKEIKQICPKCAKCHPIQYPNFHLTTAGCGEAGCCNTATYGFICRTTKEDFLLSIKECDFITWWIEEAVE